MKINQKKWVSLFFGASAALLFNSCGDKEEKDEEEAEATPIVQQSQGSQSNLGDEAIDASSIEELNLGDVLALKAPDAIEASSQSSAALNLVESKKSREACEVGNNVKQGLSRLHSVANMFCHIEIESDKIEFGKKYKINVSNDPEGGDETLAIWVDDSNKANGEIKVNFCQGSRLSEVIEIKGFKDDGTEKAVKGQVHQIHISDDPDYPGTYKTIAKFDINYTESGKQFLSVNESFASDNEDHKRQIVLNLSADGVKKIYVSGKGTHQGNTFSHSGAARVNANYGQVLFKNQGTHQDQVFDFSHRAFFDSDGLVVAADASPSFESGEELFVLDAEVPKYLGEDFAIDDFAADAWDCSTDEEISLDMSGEKGQKHAACGDGPNKDHVNCWSEEFEQSNVEHDINEDEQKDASEFEDVSKVEEIEKEVE